MGYLKEFQTQISNRDFAKFMMLWEEYCTSDRVPVEEMSRLLEMIKASDFVKPMGAYVETLIPLLQTLPESEESYKVLKLIVDIQTTNKPALGDIVMEQVQKRHGRHPKFQDLLRLANLRNKDNYQSSLSAMDLLAHLDEGKFIFHNGGWGVGEIMELSFLKEVIVVEFDKSPGRKTITFVNAIKTLTPLKDDHFLARRFGNPDDLEKDARENPVAVLKSLLKDLGPKTASEIKDEMCGLVIPEGEWTKWWQSARGKLKKDLGIECPDSLKEPFSLREAELSHNEQLMKTIGKKKEPGEIIAACHSFSKEYGAQLKDPAVKDAFNQILEKLKSQNLKPAYLLEIAFLKHNLMPDRPQDNIELILSRIKDWGTFIEEIHILQFKKQALQWIKEKKADWIPIFLTTLEVCRDTFSRDFIFKEMMGDSLAKVKIEEKISALLKNPALDPELYFWCFQRYVGGDKDEIPLSDANYRDAWWEGLLILLSQVENTPSFNDLTKKINELLIKDRYFHIRELFKKSSLEFVKEFLLLGSKSHSLLDHDQKSIRSLAAVHYPELAAVSKSGDHDKHDQVLWTTEDSYVKAQERIKYIATIETLDNAKEIEAARALGDLRENAEYKYAKERRARLQGEMKRLSDEIGRARIITPLDISNEEAGIGSVVKIEDSKGMQTTYTILGAWDADPENNILSVNSKLAQSMIGMREGDSFQFKDEKIKILSLKTIFDS